MSVTVLPDGTRVYSNRTRYTPVPDSERKKKRRKPDDPAAVRWKGDWLLPIPLLPDTKRQLPETRPDTIAFDHAYKRKCYCQVCKRPQARLWRLKYRRQMRKGPSTTS